AIDSFRKRSYADAEYWLHLALESDLDRLITRVMTAWAQLGEGNAGDALATLAELDGPEWFDLFSDYHSALIAEQAGLNDAAREAYRSTVENRSGGSSAPDTYLRAMMAQARFLARIGERDEALRSL